MHPALVDCDTSVIGLITGCVPDVQLPSVILCLQTLNLENFEVTMYSAIRATNYASSAFWLAWVIMGKYILLMLFLAVTLDAFERKYEVSLLGIVAPLVGNRKDRCLLCLATEGAWLNTHRPC
jgi:hypothetical protein